MASFSTTLKAFLEELQLTFPELQLPITRAAGVSVAQYWKSWVGSLDILLTRDVKKLFEERKGFIIGAVRMTPALWGEISEKTQAAIWKYLRTLTLESAMDTSLEGLDTDTMQVLMDILTAEKMEADPEAATSEMFEESMNHMKPLMEKLKGLIGSTGFIDVSGFTMPEIPERLRNGRISKLAEELAKQFNPAEFGIDPAMLSGDNVEEILKRLADMYQKDPTQLLAGAKRVAERIKKQILGGSLNRDELIAEAEEYITLFKEHPQFKEMFEKFTGIMGPGGLASMFGGGGASEGAPSERRRAVQERLRKKMAARKEKAAPK